MCISLVKALVKLSNIGSCLVCSNPTKLASIEEWAGDALSFVGQSVSVTTVQQKLHSFKALFGHEYCFFFFIL